jgi:manganese oxidase
MVTRRELLSAGAIVAGGLTVSKNAQAATRTKARKWESSYSGIKEKPMRPGKPGRDYQPVITPGNTTLPFKIVDGVKVYHLIAEEVDHEFCPGLKATCWGYNGRVHGPTIEAVEGDKVRVYVTNRLIAPTTVHWHGLSHSGAGDSLEMAL